MRCRHVVAVVVVAALGWLALGPESRAGRAAEPVRAATVYTDPGCSCGVDYGRYLEANGFAVTLVVGTPELDAIKAKYKVPHGLQA